MKKQLLLLICIFSGTVRTQELTSQLEGKERICAVAIIGGGPAGLAAALPPARAGLKPCIFEGPKPLGELSESYVVENWPGVEKGSGAALMQKFEKQVEEFDARILPYNVTDVDFSSWPYKLTLNDGSTLHALTIIIATGASQKKLNIEGETTYWGKGLFSCGICDGSYTRGKDTIVIGGGDIAIQRVLQLAYLAQKVTIIAPEPALTAHESMIKKLDGLSNVTKIYNKEVTKIIGDGSKISEVELRDTATGELSQFPTQSIFLSSNLTPNTDLFTGKLSFDTAGCIQLPNCRTQETQLKGVFAAGTVADPHYRQIGVIIGDGTKAGIDAKKFLDDRGYNQHTARSLYEPAPLDHPSIRQAKDIQEFEEFIDNERPVLVEFYSPLCSVCRKMKPVLIAVAKEQSTLPILQVNREDDNLYPLVERYKLNALPTFMLFLKGKILGQLEGEVTLEQLKTLLAQS